LDKIMQDNKVIQIADDSLLNDHEGHGHE
jgi:hypothetical protein